MNDPRPVAIVGLGCVGLPLALHFAEAGSTVIGLDLVLLVTHHRALDYGLVAQSAALLVETRHAFASHKVRVDRYF